MQEPAPDDWNDFTYRQYLDDVEGDAREWCLPWVQMCRFAKRLPQGYEFFQDRLAVLGIDRLGLDSNMIRMLLEAISEKGAGVPGTPLVLRVVRPWLTVFGPASGGEPVLPNHWLEGLEVWDEEQRLWIGRRVLEQPLCPTPFGDAEALQARASQEFENYDWSMYEETRFGWKLLGTPPLPDELLEERDRDGSVENIGRITGS